MDIRSQIAPKGLEFKSNEFVISDKYACILTVISYPKFIYPGYLSSLTSMSGIKVVIKHIPVPFSVMRSMLNKQINDYRDKYEKEKDKTLQERLRQDYESLENFVQQIAANQDMIFDFQLHVMIMANTKEQLENRKENAKNYFK